MRLLCASPVIGCPLALCQFFYYKSHNLSEKALLKHAAKNVPGIDHRVANSQAMGKSFATSSTRTTRSVHVYRKHQEGASEQFGLEAIGVKGVAKDDSDTHQRVSCSCCMFLNHFLLDTAAAVPACTALSSGPQGVMHSSSSRVLSFPSPVLCHLWQSDVLFPEYAALLQLEPKCTIDFANLLLFFL